MSAERPVTEGSGERPGVRDGMDRSIARWTASGMDPRKAEAQARKSARNYDRRADEKQR